MFLALAHSGWSDWPVVARRERLLRASAAAAAAVLGRASHHPGKGALTVVCGVHYVNYASSSPARHIRCYTIITINFGVCVCVCVCVYIGVL